MTNKRKQIFISTTLPYINSNPHIGHFLEFWMAMVIKNFYNTNTRHQAVLNVGLDEHGEKVLSAAEAASIPVRDYVDGYAISWMEFCNKFGIVHDTFYRTSDYKHYERVALLWEVCLKAGDLYKGTYQGRYCVGCESYKVDADLVNGKCPDHPSLFIVERNEEVWFFRLPRHIAAIREHVTKDFLIPSSKLEELKNLLEGTRDFPISRPKERLGWGIPVPGDPTQTIYVWFEALMNYVFAAGLFTDKPKFDAQWSNSLQLCGPDNLRFQAILFQGILASAGLPFTKQLLVHGTITDDKGRKMSKSEGNVVDPLDQLEKFGLDAVRYYAIAGLSTTENSGWSELELVKIYNSHLADSYGNLLSRVLHLVEKFQVGQTTPTDEQCNFISTWEKKIIKAYEEYRLKDVTVYVQELLAQGNKYITEQEPWKKTPEEMVPILSFLTMILNCATNLLHPILPEKCETAREAILNRKKINLFPRK